MSSARPHLCPQGEVPHGTGMVDVVATTITKRFRCQDPAPPWLGPPDFPIPAFPCTTAKATLTTANPHPALPLA